MEELKRTTPYMLRNDGELISCGEIHPYIKMYYGEGYEANIKELNAHKSFLDWFYENTKQEEVKKLIDEFRNNQTEEIFNRLSDLTNQEFCRVRTSNFKYKYGGNNGEIYFRLSSNGYNWYDLIWNVVNKFKRDIKTVTIMRDFSTFGKQFDYCEYKGNVFNKMPIDNFLTMSGNPVVEGKINKKFTEDDLFNEEEMLEWARLR